MNGANVAHYPRRDKSQQAAILRVLLEAKGSWIGLPEILKLGIAQYSARIHELRRLGFIIENKLEVDHETGARHSWFRLIGSLTEDDPTAAPAPSAAAAGEDRLRVTGLPLWDSRR
jgi:hypothetical protein